MKKKNIFFLFQMCMSVALLSPTQYELAYKDPDYSSNNTESTKDPKMHLRGEVFLAAGNF